WGNIATAVLDLKTLRANVQNFRIKTVRITATVAGANRSQVIGRVFAASPASSPSVQAMLTPTNNGFDANPLNGDQLVVTFYKQWNRDALDPTFKSEVATVNLQVRLIHFEQCFDGTHTCSACTNALDDDC